MTVYRITLVLLLAVVTCLLPAQATLADERGLGVEEGVANQSSGNRRALVVGISRYANLPESQQLRFADDDAEMVYAFLKSDAGGPTDEAVLLRDEEATAARIIAELTRMRDVAQAGDEVIFYFAGHGDVERIAQNVQRGRLLAYDAPSAQNYVGNGGTVPLLAVQDVMGEIIDKGARVIILTDACRSGTVNTSLNDGAQMTSSVLASNWSKGFRFASSGANQLSEENEELGHGVFTYYMLNGLLGAADGMVTDIKDGIVDHTELNMYVVRQLARNTDGQTPVVSGDPHRPLSFVSADVTWDSLESLVPQRADAPQYRLLAELDTAQRSAQLAESLSPEQAQLVEDFETALQGDSLMSEGGAAEMYEALRGNIPSGYFKRFGELLATALEDYVQATFSDYLSREEIPGSGGGIGGTETDALLSLPSEDISEAADALEFAIALRGATYLSYPSMRTRQQFLRGWAAVVDGDYEAAVGLLEKVNPPTAFALNALGFTYYQLDDTAAAAKALAGAVERAPNWSEPRRFQGFVAQYEGETQAALEFYAAAAALAPENARLQVDIGEVHAESGDLIAAMEAWRLALDINAEDMAGVIATYILDRLVVADRDELVDSIYAEALMREPRNTYLLVDRADFYRIYDRYDDAEADYRAALKIDSEYVAAHNGLGLMYEQREMFDEADAAYSRTAELAPDAAYPFRNLGDVYAAQERNDEAIEAFEQAIRNDSESTGAMQGLARVFVVQEDFVKAEEQLVRITEIDADASAFNNLGIFYEVHVNRYSEALAAYEKAREIGPTAEILANVGDAYRRLGRYYQAASAYMDALRLDPSQEYALDGLDRLEDHGVVPPRVRTVERLTGRLDPDGETLDDGSVYTSHTLIGKAGDEWTIVMRSDAFDPYMMVYENSESNYVELAKDDDSGSDTDASIVLTLPRDGSYDILANTYDQGEFGDYEIILMRSRAEGSDLGDAQVFRGELYDDGEPMDDGSFYQVHMVPAQAGEEISLTLASAAFDAYMFLLDPEGDVLIEDDDSAEGTNAYAAMTAPIGGDYTVVVNSVEPESVGPYTLTVRRGAAGVSADPLGDAEVFRGELSSSSDTMNDNTYFEAHVISSEAGEVLDVTMASSAFDVYLYVFDKDGNVLAEDDDSAGGTNARLSVTVPTDGDYVIVANCVGEGSIGPYTISVQRN